MKIETKFTVKDNVFCMLNNKIEKLYVVEIEIIIHPDKKVEICYHVTYKLNYMLQSKVQLMMYDESKLFATKEELIKSL